MSIIPKSLSTSKIFLVGIKGTGMSALAELFSDRGAAVTGSDTGETFYTDGILRSLEIRFFEDFDADHIDSETSLVVHSAAYSRDTHPELVRASELGIPILNYPEALGAISALSDSSGITGAHGKSTTTAIAGTLMQHLDIPVSVLAGTAVPTFGNRSTVSRGSMYFIAETCEYRRHFLHFKPARIVLTNVDLDHTDYFSSYDDMRNAFVEYGSLLPSNGELIFCADDGGASEVASLLERTRPDLRFTPYGRTAPGDFGITDFAEGTGEVSFSLRGFTRRLSLGVPGAHTAFDAVAAIALMRSIVRDSRGKFSTNDENSIAEGLKTFHGSRRRSQIVADTHGVLIIDDYGHHPTAVKKTIEGYRRFYPGRRIILDFMPHMYSRTKDLFEDFFSAFDEPDIVILHKIYSSAREALGEVSGKDLYDAVRGRRKNVHYFHEVMDALETCESLLEPGDVFITMGAGDNWKLGKALASLTPN
ncbi:MAG: UDP-N-acetylmuramate--L-alanine ligase, partial [Spirochaetales bacterium]|nr:UDP-N-acetylmuramate--L-alanine ligase [Spirochaetales bacterium]